MAHLHDSVPEATRADKTGVVLTVTGLAETEARLRGIVEASNFTAVHAAGIRAAARLLKKRRVFAILCDRDLADGTFRDVLVQARRRKPAPLVIVTGPHADEQLWGEVLNLGGYDVLAQPLEDAEAGRSVVMAWLHWKTQRGRIPARSSKGAPPDKWSARTASA